jgi:hypothetical protein
VVPIQAILLLKQNDWDIESNQEVVALRFPLHESWIVKFYDQTRTIEIVQKTISLPTLLQDCHLITDKIFSKPSELCQPKVGLLDVFLQHRGASITINENCCADARSDLES